MKPDRLISFASVHHALKAEKLLLEAGISVTMLPTPREISISCGQCLIFSSSDQEKLLHLLANAAVHWSKLYSCSQDRVFELLTDRRDV